MLVITMDSLREIYAKKAISQIPRLLSLQDRNEFSPTYGCFDRLYWHDKVIDFPSALSQFGIHTLALVFTYKFPDNIYFRNEKIKKWCIAGMNFWTGCRNKAGSMDEFFPNENSWGAAAFTLYAVLDSYKVMKKEIPDKISDHILDTAHKVAKYLIENDEPGILANHQAMASLAVYTAYETLNDEYFLKGFERKLGDFLRFQSSEGWSQERDGADLGYLSATISFLAKLYKVQNDKRIFNVLEKGVEFTSYFVYPNKFYGGAVGSRSTLHFYPHGYEILSREIPLAGAIADKMLEGLKEGTLVPPEIMADRYFLYRTSEYLQAYLDYKPRRNNKPKLPCEKAPFTKYFDHARLFICKTPMYYLVVGVNKGGVIKLFSISPPKLVFSDCGMIGILTNGKLVSTQWADSSYETKIKDGEIEISGKFHVIPTKLPSPVKMILFRSILLSVGSNARIAYHLKNTIIRWLMTENKTVPIKFMRKIKYSENVEVQDVINIFGKASFKSLGIGDEFSVIHVPQSRYFQTQELSTKSFNLDYLVKELNKNREVVIKRKIDFEKDMIDVMVGK